MTTKTIRINEELHERLYRFKNPSENYGTAIKRLYDEHPDTDE